MAINVGSRPEQLLRGVDRLVAVVAEAIPLSPSLPRREAVAPPRWLIERGTTRVEIPVNVLGGFPGALRVMNRLDDVRVLATVRYLVVGEGTPNGFALPMRDIVAVARVRPGGGYNVGLRIWYRDGDRTGSFFLDCRGLSRGISGITRADQMMEFLIERGVTPIASALAGRMTTPWVSWSDAEAFAGEGIVWSGDGIAAVGGWFGATRDHCRVWFTESALMWAASSHAGLNRIELTDIVQARDGVGDRVSIGIADALGHRFDLAFELVGGQRDARRVSSPAMQLMERLAERGVPVQTATSPLAPWRAGSVVRPMDRNRA
ncbi:MAG TPA: hypothetical protein VKZ61_13140 [Thermomicrobiales bacterium]|nr:hypothetical protein [Thermomicrobiales bacterium]